MQIGFNLPISGPMASAEVMANIAQLGEALGFDYLHSPITSHPRTPARRATRILPLVRLHTRSRPPRRATHHGRLDRGQDQQHTHRPRGDGRAASASCRNSRRCRQPSMCCRRSPVVGIGTGWLKAELDVVSTTPFAERGAVTDEYWTPCGRSGHRTSRCSTADTSISTGC